MARRVAAHGAFLPIEREAQDAGYQWIAGLDEAGRGPLAGPVVAAAVVLPAHSHIVGLRDSKRLTARQRDVVYERIQQQAIAYGIASAHLATTRCVPLTPGDRLGLSGRDDDAVRVYLSADLRTDAV